MAAHRLKLYSWPIEYGPGSGRQKLQLVVVEWGPRGFLLPLRQAFWAAESTGLAMSYGQFHKIVVRVRGSKVVTAPRPLVRALAALGAVGLKAPTADLVGLRTLRRALREIGESTQLMRSFLNTLLEGKARLKPIEVRLACVVLAGWQGVRARGWRGGTGGRAGGWASLRRVRPMHLIAHC